MSACERCWQLGGSTMDGYMIELGKHQHAEALALAQLDAARCREALYPLVVGCLTADANEDAPEFVNDEPYNGRRALPECVRCCGSGSTDGTEYVDVAIPEHLRCPDCGGWGFLKHPLAPVSTSALDAVRAEEREACAIMADFEAAAEYGRQAVFAPAMDKADTANRIAAAIRARAVAAEPTVRDTALAEAQAIAESSTEADEAAYRIRQRRQGEGK